MDTLETSQLVTVLQTAVGPVVVISGVGLLLLTMTNRLGRIVDRSRALAHQARATAGEEQEERHAPSSGSFTSGPSWCAGRSPLPPSASSSWRCW